MKEQNQKLFERYLTGEMTIDERHDMEKRLQIDFDLRQELMQYELVIDSLRMAQREELKARFRDRDKILDKGLPGKKWEIQRRDIWLFAAAALVIVLLVFNFLMPRENSEYQSEVKPLDTIQEDKIKTIPVDTIQTNPVPEDKPDMAEKMSDRKTKTMKERGEELYAANFEPYRDDEMDPTSRSDEEGLSDLEKFQVSYWEGRYKEAISGFETLTPEYKNNLNFQFIYAMALMQLKRSEDAASILREIRKDPGLIYYAESGYYLALYQIRQGSFETAKKLLTEYIEHPDGTQKEGAKKLL
ncbi:MAG: hypothetical protein M3R25_10600, partial [Bacteroidota bacterium]|nr:hypothetical protein [Bacteroidota bacterium]